MKSSSSSGSSSSKSRSKHATWFLIGAVRLNNEGEEALMSIKARKSNTQKDKVVLSTSDFPPIPVRAPDVLRVAFWLENCSTDCHRSLLVELAVAGDMLVKAPKVCKEKER